MYDQRCIPKRWSNIGSMLCTQRQRINQFPTLDLRKSAIGTQFTWLHFKKKTKMYRSNINITLLKPITVLHGKHIKWEPCLIATPDALISCHLPREFELFTCRIHDSILILLRTNRIRELTLTWYTDRKFAKN